jgi:uridine kinase
MRLHPYIIAIAGGSGSGKTLLAQKLSEAFQPRTSRIIPQDAYYKSLPSAWKAHPTDYNFDHPDSLDWDLLLENLLQLKHGRTAAFPRYCFVSHQRVGVEEMVPGEVLLFEGTMILHDHRVLSAANLKVFLDVPADVRFLRRLERDVRERGRTPESVIQQYRQTVRPMHLEYVESCQPVADLILPDDHIDQWVKQVWRSLPDKLQHKG